MQQNTGDRGTYTHTLNFFVTRSIPKIMLKPNAKTLARKEAFRKIGAAITRRGSYGPTLFNPHFEIRGRPSQDRKLSHPQGPKLKTLQWEATGRRPK